MGWAVAATGVRVLRRRGPGSLLPAGRKAAATSGSGPYRPCARGCVGGQADPWAAGSIGRWGPGWAASGESQLKSCP